MLLIILVSFPKAPVGAGGSSFVQLCSASGRIQQCVPREQEEICATSQVPLSPNIWQSMAMEFSGHEIIFLPLTSVNNRKVEFLTHKFYFVSLSPNLPLLGIYFCLPFSVLSHVTDSWSLDPSFCDDLWHSVIFGHSVSCLK